MTLGLQKQGTVNGQFQTVLIWHVLAWALFLIYDMATVVIYTGHLGHIGVLLLYYCINISLFYVHAFFILPFAFSRPAFPYFRCLLLVLAEMALCLLAKGLADHFIESFSIPFYDLFKFCRYLLVNAWRGIYFLGFATVYWLVRRMIRYRAAAAEARNAYLQQQINPHFLFNSLNFIYNSVYKYSPEASECVLQLAEMMRYSLCGPDPSGKTALADEIEQLSNLIRLNRLRYNFELFLDFEMTGELAELKIIPLALLTLAENIFKHGNLKDRDKPAKIELSVSGNGRLRFSTFNYKKRKSAAHSQSRVGLSNTFKRLDYAYGKNYSLEVTDEPETYYVELNIVL